MSETNEAPPRIAGSIMPEVPPEAAVGPELAETTPGPEPAAGPEPVEGVEGVEAGAAAETATVVVRIVIVRAAIAPWQVFVLIGLLGPNSRPPAYQLAVVPTHGACHAADLMIVKSPSSRRRPWARGGFRGRRWPP